MKRFFLIVCAIISLIGVANAQDGNNTSYFLSNLPQRFRLNPAYQPEYKVFIGLPALSGISINYQNSSFTPESLLTKRNDSVYMDIDKFYKSLHKQNYILFNNENSIFSLGIRAKKWYATLDITQKNDFLFRYNKDIFTFLKYGNAEHPNMDFGNLGVNANSYVEFALGLSKQVNNKLTVGARLKYLMGIATVQTTDSELSVNTDLNDGTMQIHSRQNIRMSAPLEILDKSTGKPFPANRPINWDDFDFNTDNIDLSYFLHAKNPGFAIDLGGEYKFNDKIDLFASLTDLGFIRWGNKEYNYSFYQDANFKWEGADISNSVNGDDAGYKSVEDAFDGLVDSLKDNFRLQNKGGVFTTMLSPKLYLGGTYKLNKTFDVGALLRASLINRMFIPAFTASVNGRLIRNISMSVSYTATRGSYANVGAGLTAKLGPIQLYLVTDNLLACNYTNTKSVSARFGINLLMGHKDHQKKSKAVEETPTEIVIAPVPVKKDTVVPDTTPKIDPVIPMKQEKVTDTEGAVVKECYVIVGSFKSKQRAENLKNELASMGFKDSAILQNEEGMYRVSIASFDNRTDCWDEVFRIRQKYSQFADAWGLTVTK